MQTIIWAFGSKAVLMLIILILPIGLSFKGKILVVGVSFVLALAGLAATTTFPIWATFILLLILALLTSYFMDQRIGKLLYKNEGQIPINEINEFGTTQNKFNDEFELLEDVLAVELTASSTFLPDKNINSELSFSEIQPLVAKKKDIHLDVEDDIAFLEGPINETELEVSYINNEEIVEAGNEWLEELEELPVGDTIESQLVDTELETGYLSDIETLLEESEEETLETDEKSWLDELAELSNFEDKNTNDTEEPTLDDFELEELFVEKEAASTREIDEEKISKQLELQR